MHRRWAFTPPVWCEFGGFSRYNFYSVGIYTNTHAENIHKCIFPKCKITKSIVHSGLFKARHIYGIFNGIANSHADRKLLAT